MARSAKNQASTETPSAVKKPTVPASGKKALARDPGAVPSESRREVLLNEAARLFAIHGYDHTSIRDIAGAMGILPGSVYYHFASKRELLAAVYAIGIEQIVASVERAIAQHDDPWRRLEAASVTHLETLLNKESYSAVVITNWPKSESDEYQDLVALRDRYEQLFVRLIADLPLAQDSDRRYLRLALLGALNWTLTWYHPGKEEPASIARRMVALFMPH